ncbi:MAG: hypothetical protein ACOZBW_03440, partial [Thermodesulfobacteriota bacterium]
RFFANPVRFFLTRRLDLRVADTETRQEDSEPFDVAGLERHRISQQIVERLVSGRDAACLYEAFRAGGLLPHGQPGKRLFETLHIGASEFAARVRAVPEKDFLGRAEVRLEIGNFVLGGVLEGVGENGWFRYRYAAARPKDWLSNWICHLAWCMAGGRGTGRFAASNGWWAFEPVENPEPALAALLDIYRQGLSRPVHFFPKSGFAYGEEMRRSKSGSKALARAMQVWKGNDYNRGEKEDPYYALWFGEEIPLNDEFEDFSGAVMMPLLEGRRSDETPRPV